MSGNYGVWENSESRWVVRWLDRDTVKTLVAGFNRVADPLYTYSERQC